MRNLERSSSIWAGATIALAVAGAGCPSEKSDQPVDPKSPISRLETDLAHMQDIEHLQDELRNSLIASGASYTPVGAHCSRYLLRHYRADSRGFCIACKVDKGDAEPVAVAEAQREAREYLAEIVKPDDLDTHSVNVTVNGFSEGKIGMTCAMAEDEGRRRP